MSIDIRTDITEILVNEFGVPPEEISFSTPYEDLSFDSLMLLELALRLKSRFGITVSESEISAAGNLDGFVALFEDKEAA
ncbi:phosphopantetheine-binding protein [Nocardia sp. alder85J]|uniref:phosphopantetheine-binding protein n=1 Tax=Nocardia sp. alder85J TaxID=2862949 RepID=UPI001CD5EF72|nr:phosphopantetheine-binding protein [Nocardia sp. alder85J]MCX4097503.1 phosphopantetheine-binding protein [Nocardia sp. alder85J]